jgi:hypothetical protein
MHNIYSEEIGKDFTIHSKKTTAAEKWAAAGV